MSDDRMLDKYDETVLNIALSMKCISFFYTTEKILNDFDISDEKLEKIMNATTKCMEYIWNVAEEIADEMGDEEGCLLLNSFMSCMVLEMVDGTMSSQCIKAAEDILKEN